MENNLVEIKEFINQWKERAIAYYHQEIESCKEDLNKAYSLSSSYEYKKAKAEIIKRYTQIIIDLARPGNYSPKAREERLIKIINKEADLKEKLLINRVNKEVGAIVKALNLKVGVNGELNGIIQGENGKCKIETIYAGGYNIQCLHYRVLVHKIND